jgi:hypothetical protein
MDGSIVNPLVIPYKVVPQFGIAKLVNITPISLGCIVDLP